MSNQRFTPEFKDEAVRQAVVARPTGFEPVTAGLEGRCSIQMSYGRPVHRKPRLEADPLSGRGGEI